MFRYFFSFNLLSHFPALSATMPLMSNIKSVLRHRPAEEEKRDDSAAVDAPLEKTEKEAVIENTAPANTNGVDTSSSDFPSKDVQRGVQEVEAVTMSWSKATLIGVFLKCVMRFPECLFPLPNTSIFTVSGCYTSSMPFRALSLTA